MVWFYRYRRAVEVWIRALVLYAAAVSEVKRTNIFVAQQKIISVYLSTYRLFWFCQWSLSEVSWTTNRGISSMCRRWMVLFLQCVLRGLLVLLFKFFLTLSLLDVCWWMNQGISFLCRLCFGGKMENVPMDSYFSCRFYGLLLKPFAFHYFCFLFAIGMFLTSDRSFSLLQLRRFGGLVVCLANTA